MRLKLGVIIPNSNFINKFGKAYLHSLKTGLGNSLEQVDIIIESGGYNADRKLLLEKATKLINSDGVDLIIAPLNTGVVQSLQGVCESNEVCLIANTLGEDVLYFEDDFDYLFVNTFDQWLSNWSLGYWAAKNIGNTCSVFLSIHEAGYKLSYAFALGFEAGNGNVVGNWVTHKEKRMESSIGVLKEADELEHDFKMGFYSSKEAISFLQDVTSESKEGYKPLLGGTFMLEPEVLNHFNSELVDIKSCTSWLMTNQEPVNDKFVKGFTSEVGRLPDAYSLLAYESGLILNKLMEESSMSSANFDLKNALSSVEIYGPRGNLKLNHNGNETRHKSYVTNVVKNNNGVMQNLSLIHI